MSSLKHDPQREKGTQLCFRGERVAGRWRQGEKGCDWVPDGGPGTITQELISPEKEQPVYLFLSQRPDWCKWGWVGSPLQAPPHYRSEEEPLGRRKRN